MTGGFLKEVTDKLVSSIPEPTYYTTQEVIDFINCQTIIANPPYDTTGFHSNHSDKCPGAAG